MSQRTKERRLKVLRLYAKGVSISDCARLAGVAYETARRYCREADVHGIEHARKVPSFRTWPIELKTEVGSRWLDGESASDLAREFKLPSASYPALFGRWLERQHMTDYEQRARAAGGRVVRAQKAGMGISQWGKWLAEIRQHIESAKQQATCDAKRQQLDALHVEILEKSCALREETDTWQAFLIRLVTTLKAHHPVSRLCRIVGLARSTYYWALKNACRIDADLELVQEAYAYAHGRYGYRRLTDLIRIGFGTHQGRCMNHKKVARLMRRVGLQGAQPKRKHYRSFAGTLACIPNRLQRRFSASKPGRCLVTDITQIKWGGTWYYLSPLTDLFNNEVVAWRLSTSPDSALVTGMVRDYSKTRNLRKTIIHTDQGRQYFSEDYRKLLQTLGVRQSMSRKGNCLDNSPAEAFFARLKIELGLSKGARTGQASLRRIITEYIHWWNTQRIVSRLHTSPLKYRQQYELAV
ncbi:IS3 family transposase [Schaalia sp. lx-100]|uniref:IS3 family transposase n=1 Tax=Schaalia sp. lx-100 TaxID=2899081 RepID=UPI001E287EC9|nr:IS3 family transposase [Schaalia sp. lx-100]MCD4557740.1 IS3 family transposase [Schaalia sp. lx-100]